MANPSNNFGGMNMEPDDEIYWRGKIAGLNEARELIMRAAMRGETFERCLDWPLLAIEKITITLDCYWDEEEMEWKPKAERAPPS